MKEKYKQLSFHLERCVSEKPSVKPKQPEHVVTMFQLIANSERLAKSHVTRRRKLKEEGKTVETQQAIIDGVVGMVSEDYSLKPEELLTARRAMDVSEARHVVWYVANKVTPLSLNKLASIFGRSDHTTVMHARTKIERQMLIDPELKARVESYVARATGFGQIGSFANIGSLQR